MKAMDLTQMKVGQVGTVVEIQGGHGLSIRLQVLGIRVGVKVIKVSSQIMRGPVTVQIGNSRVAIGFGMARKIIARVRGIG